MKAEQWQSYQSQGRPIPPGGTSGPDGWPSSPFPKKSGHGSIGWPLAVLFLGLGLIGGCCYSLSLFLDSTLGPLESGLSEPGVGVVVLADEIYDSMWFTEALEDMAEDENIKSLVIRIDSPGGAVAPCQEMYKAVEAFPKPVVVSMGSVAASGGLYVAAAGDWIMANPGTITGSIGVIMQLVEVEGAMAKLGLKAESVKSGPFKDMGSPFRPLASEERELLQNMVGQVYGQFVADLVASQPKRGQRALSEERIKALADGRIFTGQQALDSGLIDQVGGFEEALRRAAKMGGLDENSRPSITTDDGSLPWWQRVVNGRLNLKLELPASVKPGLNLKYLYQPALSSLAAGGE